MEALVEIGIFAAKSLIVLSLVGGLFILLASIAQAGKQSGERLTVTKLNARYNELQDALKTGMGDSKAVRRDQQRRKKSAKDTLPRTFVLDFDGDVQASSVESLRDEINAVIQVANEGDDVLLRLESPGGTVTGYGLAAAQLERLRARNISVTAAVDLVAASGGYMMACTADRIIAAPFAVVGSIGVLAIVPNANEALKRLGIGVHEFTAGKYKRTVSTFSEITPGGRDKFLEDLEETHTLFKDFVQANRPQLDVERVATGEHWHARQALELQLVDEIMTSDDFLISRIDSHALVQVEFEPARTIGDRLPLRIAAIFDAVAARWALAARRSQVER